MYIIYNQVKTFISKYYPVLVIQVIRYKRQILILAFLFVIAVLIFYYRDSIMEVVIKLVQLLFKLLAKLKNEQASPNSTKNENSKNSNTVYEETEDKTTIFYCYGPKKPRDYKEDTFIVKNNWKDCLYYLFRRRRYPCMKVEWYNPTPYISKKKDYNLSRKPMSWVQCNFINRALGNPTATSGHSVNSGKFQTMEQKVRHIIWARNNKYKYKELFDNLSATEIKELDRVTKLNEEAGRQIYADFKSRYAKIEKEAVDFGNQVNAEYLKKHCKSGKVSSKIASEGLQRGMAAGAKYLVEHFKDSEENNEDHTAFILKNSRLADKLNNRRQKDYINGIGNIFGFKIGNIFGFKEK